MGTFRTRALRSTGSAPIFDADADFGNANDDGTSVQQTLLEAHVRRWRPGTAGNTTDSAVPAVGAAPSGQCWRTLAGEPLSGTANGGNYPTRDEPFTMAAGDCSVRVRRLRSGGIGTNNITATVTAILYRMSSANVFVGELGRAALSISFTTTVGSSTWDVPVSQTDFDAGDKIQVEFYVDIPSNAGVSQNLIIRLDNSDANAGSRFTAPAITVHAARSHSARMAGVDSLARAVQLARTLSARMAGRAATPKRAVSLASTSIGAARMAGRAATPKRKVALASTSIGAARMAGVAAMNRALTLFRTFSRTATGIATVLWRKAFGADAFKAVMLGRDSVTWHKRFDPASFGSVRMAGVASMVKRFGTAFSAVLKGVAATPVKQVAKEFAAARMAGVGSLARALTIRRTFGARAAGVATVVKRVGTSFSARMAGVASVTRLLTLFRAFTGRMAGAATVVKRKTFAVGSFGGATMVGVATMARALTIRRALAAVGKGVARALANMDFRLIPTGGGGEGGGGSDPCEFVHGRCGGRAYMGHIVTLVADTAPTTSPPGFSVNRIRRRAVNHGSRSQLRHHGEPENPPRYHGRQRRHGAW